MKDNDNSQLSALHSPFPPTEVEQRAIAIALSDVDALLHGLDRLIAKKRDIKQAAMQQLLTGETRLPGFEGEWEEVRLGDLFSFKNGLNKAREFFGHGTPIVNYMDVFKDPVIRFSQLEGRVSLTTAELKPSTIQGGCHAHIRGKHTLFGRTYSYSLEIKTVNRPSLSKACPPLISSTSVPQ